MKEHRYAELAARFLRTARTRIGPHRAAPPADAVATLAGVIRDTVARRRRRRVVRLAGAVAGTLVAALALAMILTRSPAPGSTATSVAPPLLPRPAFVAEGSAVATITTRGGAMQPLSPGQAWHPGERLHTDAHGVALTTGDETAIAVTPHSELELVRADAERWLRLGSGAVEVHVAKLRAFERFVLATPDAEVEVRGTRFRVAVVPAIEGCGQGTVTRVSVTEGVVVVRASGRESRVEAGSHWPTECAEPVGSVAARPRSARPTAPIERASQPASAVQRPPPGDLSTSTLATENDLFSAALKAESAGDRRASLQLLDVLLARFPASPLRESAALERARLIDSTQPRP
jgi:hypothetical protein